MRYAWLLIALSACGRLGFDGVDRTVDAAPDARPCSPVGHDEDKDSVDDACDVCPHLPDVAQRDGDGDGVGDACDPHPADAIDRIVAFDPFTSLSPEWSFAGEPVTSDGENLVVDTRTTGMFGTRSLLAARETFVFGGHLGAGSTTRDRQITIAAHATPNQSFYCELFDDANPTKYALTYTLDSAAYQSVDVTPAQDPLESSDFTLAFTVTATTFACDTTYPATRSHLEAPLPGGLGARSDMGFAIQGVVASYHYFLHIHSEGTP